jgi:serine protease Do
MMAYPRVTSKCGLPEGLFALFLLLFFSSISVFPLCIEANAQTLPPDYAQAESAFMSMALDQRVKTQVLLTAAGYWPAVPTANFNSRLFEALEKFQVDNGFVPLGFLSSEQMERLQSVGGPYLDRWRFEAVKHPAVNVQIWVPIGLPMLERPTPTGLMFTNSAYGVLLAYDFYPEFNLRFSLDALLNKLQRTGAKIYYSKLYQDEFFVVSYSDGVTDAYVRYHHVGTAGIGFSLYWNHNATDAHIERIATLISGSLWSTVTGAPFTSPFTVTPQAPEVVGIPGPAPEPQPGPPSPALPQPERHTASSGTGIYITSDGHLLTNAHVVQDCSDIQVETGQGIFEVGKLVAKDTANDLALLKVSSKPKSIGALRFTVRLGENVEAFGYPLSQVLAASGNFTTGNITALAGLGDDSRFFQISAPVQPGNSGGLLLDESGNLIGIVSSKLNFLSEIKNAGDIPQNVNFAIKASVVENFLQDNGVKFQIGEASEPMKAPDLADQAKSLSAYIVCQ